MNIRARAGCLYEFGPFRLNTAERLLMRDGQAVPLTEKAFNALAMLIENSGHLLEREEMLTAIWHDSFVEEANLTVTISAVRKALGEQAGRAIIYRDSAETWLSLCGRGKSAG